MSTAGRTAAIVAAGLLASCAQAPSAQSAPQVPETIEFATTPCFGSCPVFSITLSSDGKGRYEGGRFVARKGAHEFTVTPAQMDAFLARLKPFRPRGEVRYDYGNCSVPVSTDSPSVEVRWKSGDRDDSLHWYLGCRDPRLIAIQPDLYDAWKVLPLDDLVGTAENRFQYDKRGG